MYNDLINFMQVATLRNDGEFSIDSVIININQIPTDIKGKIKVDGNMVDTMWAPDGSNRTHGYMYDLVKAVSFTDFMNQ